jgi:hypothetical protein
MASWEGGEWDWSQKQFVVKQNFVWNLQTIKKTVEK